jgi:hypothetical protein
MTIQNFENAMPLYRRLKKLDEEITGIQELAVKMVSSDCVIHVSVEDVSIPMPVPPPPIIFHDGYTILNTPEGEKRFAQNNREDMVRLEQIRAEMEEDFFRQQSTYYRNVAFPVTTQEGTATLSYLLEAKSASREEIITQLIGLGIQIDGYTVEQSKTPG